MRYKKLKTLVIGISLIMHLSACGNANGSAEVVATSSEIEVETQTEESIVIEESERKEEPKEAETEQIEEEEHELIPYFDENRLEFCEDLTPLTVKAVRIDINDKSVYEEIDAECVIKDVSIENTEDGLKTITIKYEVTGELYDSYEKRFLQVIMPNAAYCDLNTGELHDIDGTLFDSEESEELTIEWNGKTYEIVQTRNIEWSSKPNWKSDGKNGYVASATMYATDSFVVPNDYNSLGMIMGMFMAEETYSGEYEMFGDAQPTILEVLENREDARLYSINSLCKLFSEDEVVTDDKDNSSTTSANNGTSKENTDNNSPSESTTSKQEQQTAHTHSYSSSVTKNPTCSENGEKTFVCSCGNSYKEAIPANGHSWTTTTETITHPSTGHYETVTKKELYCNCGATFSSMDQLNAHTETHTEGDPGRGVRETSENVWVVDSSESQETVTITKCAVCGAQG